jgi:queuine/archaeosine tRNA-ribosyltransferase
LDYITCRYCNLEYEKRVPHDLLGCAEHLLSRLHKYKKLYGEMKGVDAIKDAIIAAEDEAEQWRKRAREETKKEPGLVSVDYIEHCKEEMRLARAKAEALKWVIGAL